VPYHRVFPLPVPTPTVIPVPSSSPTTPGSSRRVAPRRGPAWTGGCRAAFSLLLIAAVVALAAVTAANPRPLDLPTPERITEAREALAEANDLDGALRDQAVALLDSTQRALEAERTAAQRLLELQQELAGLPAQREAIVAEMALMVDTPIVPPADATIEQVRAARDEAEATLRTAQERQAALDRELLQRAERRGELPDEIAALEDALNELEQSIATAAPPDLAPTLATPRIWALASQQAELIRRIAAARAELALIDARPEIDALRRERAARRISVRESAARQWRTIVAAAEARRAEAAAADARRAAAEASPAVRAVAERTADLVDRLNNPDPELGVAVANRNILGALSAIELRLARLARQYDQDRRRVIDIGMAGLTTARLQRQRSELPELRRLTSGRTQLRDELGAVQRELTDLEVEREALPSLLEQRERILAEFPRDPDDAVHSALVAELDRSLAERQRAMDTLIAALRERDEVLLQIQDRLIPLTALTREYITFIDQRILWLRSMDAINVRDVGAAWESTWSHIQPSALGGFVDSASRRLAASPALPALLAIGVGVIAWVAVKVRRRRSQLAELVSRPHTDLVAYTVEATVTALAWAAVWPLAIYLVALMVGSVDDPAALGPRIASGLRHAAWVLLGLRLVGEITRRSGLAIAHYGWRPESCALVRRQLRWYGPLVLLLIFIQGAIEFEQALVGTDALARLATMALAGASALVLLRLFGPRRGLLVGLLSRSRASWLDRSAYLLYPILVGVPLLLIVLDTLGFSYTVNQLHFAIYRTVLFGLALLLVAGLVTRWMLITRRRLAMDEARKRRAAAVSGDTGQATTADGDALAIESANLDLVTVDAQTRQLMRTSLVVTIAIGLFLIWGAMLPALGMLGRIELWPRFAHVHDALVAPPPLEAVIGEQAASSIRRTAVATTGRYVPVFTAAGVPLGSPVPPQQQATPPAVDGATPPTGGTSPPSAPTSPPPSPPSIGTTTAQPQAAPTDAPIFPGMPAPARNDSVATTEDRGRVTVANLLLAAFITVLAILISRNIPGLVEVVLLQRLPMTPSGRYAVTALTRYVIAVLAIFMAFGAIGVGWSQVQWLVAAATVGLGFGLQEIVANFISGVIILFEQPIRVGDTVTVGNVSGTVTKIRMRATTITDWDRKELLIPNKEFITGQVINWTLSDPTLRLVVSVGIAYGSDTAAAERLLLEAARNHPIVLRDPPPSVVFSRFGESSLDFDLRVFLPSIEFLVRTRHDLHNAIDQAFRKEGIKIAFPQRDVHVRDIAGQLGIRRGGGRSEEKTDETQPAPTVRDANRTAGGPPTNLPGTGAAGE